MILVPQFNFISEPRRGFPKVKQALESRVKAVVAFSPTMVMGVMNRNVRDSGGCSWPSPVLGRQMPGWRRLGSQG